jgi:DNA-binding NarL/FixJ family response regulator
MSSIRVLVADDFAPFRRFICATLGKRKDLQVICEAADGLEAVQQADQLKPELIVLDVGLPKLNGLVAARQICELSPDSKILFVSQETSPDVVQEAFDAGALGYVGKTKAGTDLLAGVEAVLEGRQFVSSGLTTDAPVKQLPCGSGRRT